MDSDARRLYIGRGNHIDVVNVDAGTLVGKITGFASTSGLLPVPELGRGFATMPIEAATSKTNCFNIVRMGRRLSCAPTNKLLQFYSQVDRELRCRSGLSHTRT